MNTWRVITSVEEAIALCEAGLLWWMKTEPAWSGWPRESDFSVYVGHGHFSILLED